MLLKLNAHLIPGARWGGEGGVRERGEEEEEEEEERSGLGL